MEKNRKKYRVILGLFMIILTLSGCSGEGGKAQQETGKEDNNSQQNILEESENLAEGYRTVYEKAKETDSLNTEGTIREIIAYLGESGYSAVDRENQINMVNAEKAESFCKEAQAGETSEGTILIVIDNGGFVRYDLSSSDGKIKVDRTNLSWDEEGNPQAKTVDSYQAAAWNYTEKGYLFLELERPAGFDGSSGHTAIRIAPLTEDLRRWNADCIMSIGYAGNNLFTTDWSAENYGDLCFYDLYEPFYKMKFGQAKTFDAKVGTKEYEIPAEEMESVITAFLPVSSETLRAEEKFDEAHACYVYRQRGQYDLGGNPDTPYPEVVDCEENGDGTITLTVDAVWKKGNTDKAFSHKVRIQPKDDGTFYYLSNQIIPSERNQIPEYVPRLTDEEWETYYSG